MTTPKPTTPSTWWVGSNGNMFRDMAGGRYCVARLDRARLAIYRNGEPIGDHLYADHDTAMRACETHAAKVQ